MSASTYSTMAMTLDELPEAISNARARRGLSLRDAAAEAGVAFSTLHRMEQGREYTSGSLHAVLLWLGDQ